MKGEIKRGDIFWYNFGKANGSEQGGLRPVAIISNNIGNRFSPTVIVAVITSQAKGNLPTHVEIREYKEIGMKLPSKILTEQTKTVDKQFLGDYIGTISGETIKQLNVALAINIGIKESKPKWLEVIEKKAKNINFKEMVLYNMEGNKCTEDRYYKQLTKEVREDLAELRYNCDKRGIEIDKYYKPYRNIKNKVA